MAINVLATADLHLGKSSSSIPGDTEAASTRYTWNRIVDFTVNHNIDVLLLCGDIIDKDNRFFEAVGPLQSGFEKLKHAGVTIYLVTGNHDHDVLSQIAKSTKYDHVHLLGFNGKWEVKTFSKNGQSIQFTGWSFPGQFVYEDPFFTFHEINLDPNIPTIGLLHGDVGNSESKYGPIELTKLLKSAVNAWILGHIHKPQEIRKDNPSIWYPGSPQAMSAKETGMHGPLFITVNSADINIRPIPLSPVRYENITIEITDTDDEADVRDKMISEIVKDANDKIKDLEEVSFLVYDVYLSGVHANIKEVEQWAWPIVREYTQEIESGTTISARTVVNRLRPAIQNLKELAKQPTPAGIVAETILAIESGNTTAFLDELIRQWDQKYAVIKNGITYQPLWATGREENKDSRKAKDYILHECNNLLSELISQQIK